MTGSTPKPQVVIKQEKPTTKPKGTTSKSGSSEAIPPPKSKSSGAPPASQTTPENILTQDPKGPPPARSQASSAGIREQSNPRGTAGRSELGVMGMMQRGRDMGFGTPSVAPQQAKGAVPHPQRVDTPPRSRSAERSGDVTTPRVDTPPRSRSAERNDGRDCGNAPILQPIPIQPATLGWLEAPRATLENRDEIREILYKNQNQEHHHSTQSGVRYQQLQEWVEVHNLLHPGEEGQRTEQQEIELIQEETAVSGLTQVISIMNQIQQGAQDVVDQIFHNHPYSMKMHSVQESKQEQLCRLSKLDSTMT